MGLIAGLMATWWRPLWVAVLLLSAGDVVAQTSSGPGMQPLDRPPGISKLDSMRSPKAEVRSAWLEPGLDPENNLLLPFLHHLADDQRQFWSSAQELRKPATLTTFLPFAGFTSALLAGDRWMVRQVPATQLQRSRDVSNFAVFSLVGVAAGSYALGRVTHNDHLRETGFLSGEAALNSTLITYAFKEASRRQRPEEGAGRGRFFGGGSSFPSEHAALAWSVASIVAHEYPGPLTKLMAYGLASTVTLTRVTGKQHFPSDVVVGSALGWYLGRQIFRARHDPELGGAAWGNLREDSEPGPRPPGRMGSTSVPLDSWVYPAIEKLAGFGYVETAFAGLKPWTRMECAQLVEQAGEAIERGDGAAIELAGLESRLREEFAYELGLWNGERNVMARVESVYARGLSVSGPVLTDGDHFGQTLSSDFGRPFRSGGNAQLGGVFRAAVGPAALFVRAEFQHAPAAPALSGPVRNFIASADLVPAPDATSFTSVNRVRWLDAYVALNLKEGWQLSFGKQSLSWASGPGESFLWSNNIEPVTMVRLSQSGIHFPGFLKALGPARVESFMGRLEGHSYIPRPYIYGNKLNFKPLRNLELGFGRTVTIGGRGGTPFTAENFLFSFLGQRRQQLNSVPGDSHTSFDWTYEVPKLRNYLVFYGDLYADDDFVPFQSLPKNPFRPGIYVTHFPRLPKLDLHLEAASTESPGYAYRGDLNYWNHTYRDGYTNAGNLIGNTVGRMGRAVQLQFRYWLSPQDTVQFTYKHNTVSPHFIPQGGAWQDYGVRHELYLRRGLYLKSQFQYEHISRYPLLFARPQSNRVAVVEVGFVPHEAR